MIDCSNQFLGTPFHQTTYELVSPEVKEEWKGAYTAWRIQSWDYKDAQKIVFDRNNMFLHEFCHCIQLWRAGKKERLLERNYGFEFGRLTWKWFLNECAVLGMQRFISEQICGDNPLTVDAMTKIYTEFTSNRGVDCSYEQFCDIVDASYSLAVHEGIDAIAEDWQALCAYVKENRDEEDLLTLLGW